MVQQVEPKEARNSPLSMREKISPLAEIPPGNIETIDPRSDKSGSFGITEITNELSETSPGDIQKIAANQTKLLHYYYNAVLTQATTSFNWALIAACTGLAFFLGAVTFLFFTNSQAIATIGAIGGAIAEAISAINFYLYGKTTTQLADFHQRLDQTQRFLLANSICESLNDDAKQTSRSALVHLIATLGTDQKRPINKGKTTKGTKKGNPVKEIEHGKQV